MFRHFRLNVGGDVFNDPRTNAVFSVALLERPAAIGATIQPMLLPAVDFLQRGAVRPRMAFLSPGFLLSFLLLAGLRGRFLEGRDHSRGGGGTGGVGVVLLQCPDSLDQLQKKKNDLFLALLHQKMGESPNVVFAHRRTCFQEPLHLFQNGIARHASLNLKPIHILYI